MTRRSTLTPSDPPRRFVVAGRGPAGLCGDGGARAQEPHFQVLKGGYSRAEQRLDAAGQAVRRAAAAVHASCVHSVADEVAVVSLCNSRVDGQPGILGLLVDTGASTTTTITIAASGRIRRAAREAKRGRRRACSPSTDGQYVAVRGAQRARQVDWISA